MNKTISAIALSAVAIFGLAACSTESKPAPTVTVTKEAPTPEPTFQTAEEAYIENIRSWGNFYVNNNSNEDLINLGYTLCSELDAGYTVPEVIQGIIDQGFDTTNDEALEFAGLVIGSAVRDLCPEYTYQIEAMF